MSFWKPVLNKFEGHSGVWIFRIPNQTGILACKDEGKNPLEDPEKLEEIRKDGIFAPGFGYIKLPRYDSKAWKEMGPYFYPCPVRIEEVGPWLKNTSEEKLLAGIRALGIPETAFFLHWYKVGQPFQQWVEKILEIDQLIEKWLDAQSDEVKNYSKYHSPFILNHVNPIIFGFAPVHFCPISWDEDVRSLCRITGLKYHEQGTAMLNSMINDEEKVEWLHKSMMGPNPPKE